MAKAKKKTPAKPAKKKPAAKPKKAAKKAVKKVAAKKKAAPKKKVAEKKAPAKKVVAKKEAPKKIAPKTIMKKGAPAKIETLKPEPKPQEVKKNTPSTQITMFQMPNQRPIAHKPVKQETEERTRYSDEELKEFEKLILDKLEKAREEYRILKDTLNRTNDEGTDATSGGNTKVLEDGAETAEKENLSQLAARQQKYITNLENALVRIKNGTYGICSVTGKLISKQRLIAVPHTTQSIEAKMMQQD